ncbi:hypothetical protein [Pseudoalteromonas luteoviolacea]|uniref:Uncharacterized protein n=1 Tax=Pseudoalteromonas luteoviolacea S4054 TaxID=1129367 RepID=A0A0F6ADT3_9GAMM|nr:hypothetical protein [Pseudoalteromonas luteoviolacea]AOT08391.1 hypothetical protein S4054249_11280 [Pseudoalteromonas luteoviolacea]AOT13307.1 hypothetical protein S40542_11255 [Pseudoalteromonas luteoviolacea]AOT18220.1 hypothetical protein S4054_11255 [Pseudoalteromonas luteoviolacea]KKE84340.1 hypothetical protein N479_10605 [Pseudoalteromonas luteoviolacea S4054]KZN76055.1 hypothetical protein N481_06810 [Pseudoalteromonas luteoviolacea S4047-1]
MISKFISDYLTDTQVATEFSANPGEVIERYKLTDAEVAVLQSKDLDKISELVDDNVKELIAQYKSNSNAGTIVTGWTDIKPFNLAINPSQLTTGGATFEIVGESLPSKAHITFVKGASVAVKATDVKVESDKLITGKVNLDATGLYDVKLFNEFDKHVGTIENVEVV